VPPAEEEGVDPQSLPYPIHADLRDLPAAEAAAAAKGIARERFLGLGQDVWQNPRGYYPNNVLISPDGQGLAYAAGENLVAGPIAAPKELGDVPDPSAAGGTGPMVMTGPRGRRIMMTPGGPMVGQPSNPLRRLVGVPVWSADSREVYFARACGQLWGCE